MALGEERQVVARRQVFECLGDPVDHFHGAFQDPLRKGHYRRQVAIMHVALAEALVAFAQIASVVFRAVSVNPGVGDLDLIEHSADLSRLQRGMVEELGELVECPLEVNVVFPKGIVGVDDQVLFHLVLGRRRNGISITTSTSTGTPSRRAGSNSHFRSAAIALLSSLASTPRNIVMPYT